MSSPEDRPRNCEGEGCLIRPVREASPVEGPAGQFADQALKSMGQRTKVLDPLTTVYTSKQPFGENVSLTQATDLVSSLGGKLLIFDVSGYNGFLIQPTVRQPRPDRGWVWAMEPWMILPNSGIGPKISHRNLVREALTRGYHLAGLGCGLTLGSPKGTAIHEQFYATVTVRHGLNSRPRLALQSNGALMGYNWASRHPYCVDRILGIFPVMDLTDWPTLEAIANRDVQFNPDLGYNLTTPQLARRLHEFNPIDNLALLADAGIPIMHVHGDQDPIVSFQVSAVIAQRRYRALGGVMTILPVPGGRHEQGPRFYDLPQAIAFLLDNSPLGRVP